MNIKERTEKCSVCGTVFIPAKYPNSQHCGKLCACVSDDAERCMALRYPAASVDYRTDDDEVERCQCSCHDFQRYDE